jgi:hypothetical protein
MAYNKYLNKGHDEIKIEIYSIEGILLAIAKQPSGCTAWK